jgi:hypothetical protein
MEASNNRWAEKGGLVGVSEKDQMAFVEYSFAVVEAWKSKAMSLHRTEKSASRCRECKVLNFIILCYLC